MHILFNAIKNKHYVDAGVATIMHANINGFNWKSQGSGYSNDWWTGMVEGFEKRVRKILSKHIYYEENVFTLKPLEKGQLSASQWKHIFTLNGEPAIHL